MIFLRRQPPLLITLVTGLLVATQYYVPQLPLVGAHLYALAAGSFGSA
ncbi:MAG TPA: hypothetical protein PKD12_23385 [Nitrospira sp.]|nr:hypothetical protein [Nitrospira sp.]